MNASALPVRITDRTYINKAHPTRIHLFFSSLLNDKRNVPFIYLMIRVLLTTVPLSIILFIPGKLRWWLAGIYFFYNILFLMGPVILMQHNAAHKPLFKRKYKFLNNIIPWVIGPFFGLTPETYFAHHIGMHHPENNLSDDLSSTMKYRRDSIVDFSKYILKFYIAGVYDLAGYLKIRRRTKVRRRMLFGEAAYFLFAILLFIINWKATIVVFIFPMLFTRFMMMAGNWAQHSFIDESSPENCFRNSITCINSNYNRTCWNDGYHIGHHIYPGMHWSEMPDEFLRNIDKYRGEDAVVFRKLDYFMVWLLLMTKSYSTLAKFYVELNQEQPRSKLEVINLLKNRVRIVAGC